MKAIVLTCDKYHPVADNMIECYQRLWPDNPFTFHIPYQNSYNWFGKYGNKVKCIRTDVQFKTTVLSLLDGLNDEEWVYWCPDDRYPIWLDVAAHCQIYEWILSLSRSVSGVLLLCPPKLKNPNNVDKKDIIRDFQKRVYVRRKNYRQIFLHQFIRVKVLRTLFGSFPDVLNQAKEMDYRKNELSIPPKQRLYVGTKAVSSFGESTARGKLTLNMVDELKRKGLSIPVDFKISDKEIIYRHAN